MLRNHWLLQNQKASLNPVLWKCIRKEVCFNHERKRKTQACNNTFSKAVKQEQYQQKQQKQLTWRVSWKVSCPWAMLAVPELGVMLPMAKSLIRSLDWYPDIHCTCIDPYEPSLMKVAITEPVTRKNRWRSTSNWITSEQFYLINSLHLPIDTNSIEDYNWESLDKTYDKTTLLLTIIDCNNSGLEADFAVCSYLKNCDFDLFLILDNIRCHSHWSRTQTQITYWIAGWFLELQLNYTTIHNRNQLRVTEWIKVRITSSVTRTAT